MSHQEEDPGLASETRSRCQLGNTCWEEGLRTSAQTKIRMDGHNVAFVYARKEMVLNIKAVYCAQKNKTIFLTLRVKCEAKVKIRLDLI